MEDISKIRYTEAIKSDTQSFPFFRQKKQKSKKYRRYSKKDFPRLAGLVETTHKELVESGSPFRLCIYQEGDDLFIDIVTLDKSGRPEQTFRHDISHEEISDIIAHIKSGRGLILDADA